MPITRNSSTRLGAEIPKKSSSPPLVGKKPFPVRSSQGRKYVRIEINSPVDFRVLVREKGRIGTSDRPCCGKILNLSCGGILLESSQAVPEGVFLLLSLNLSGLVLLEGVLGKAKRVEPTGDGKYLTGVEFCSTKELEGFALGDQIEKLPVKVASFNSRIKEIISGYTGTASLVTHSTHNEF